MQGIFKNKSFFFRVISLILFFFFFSSLGVILGVFITGGNVISLQSVRILQIIQSVFTFIIPCFFLAYLWTDEKPIQYLQLNKLVSLKNILLVVLFMLLIIPFINLLSDLNQRIVLPDFMLGFEEQLKMKEAQTTELTEQLLNVNTIGGLLFNLFLIGILPAFCEELFFRGTIQRMVTGWQGAIVAIWVSASIFSAFHFQFYGFIPRVLLGAVFGYFLFWSKNLWIPIIAHLVNNSIIVLYYYLKQKGINMRIDLDTIGSNETWWIGCISGIIFIGSFFFFKKYFVHKEKPCHIE